MSAAVAEHGEMAPREAGRLLGAPCRPRGGRGLRTVLVAAAVALVLGLAVAALATKILGLQGLSVLSGSMFPAIATGDVVVNAPIRPLDARPGDIVTFKDPRSQSRLITHRVRDVQRHGGLVHFVTKGDANNTPERWRVGVDGRIGRTVARVPRLGFALGWLGTPLGRFGFIVLPALLLGVAELVRIWRADPPETGSDDAAA